MKESIKILLYIIGLFCFMPLQGNAQDSLRDSTYQVRMPDEKFLEKFQNDPAFTYEEKIIRETWWDRFASWLSRKLFGKRAQIWNKPLEYFLMFLAFSLLAFAIYRIVKNGVLFPWGGTPPAVNSGILQPDECEDEEAYPSLIKEAEDSGDFVKAVRLYFIYMLFLMDRKGLVKWDTHKTNSQYARELEGDTRTLFRKVGFVFDCVSYGDFKIGREEYERIKALFQDFQQKVIL